MANMIKHLGTSVDGEWVATHTFEQFEKWAVKYLFTELNKTDQLEAIRFVYESSVPVKPKQTSKKGED